MEDKYKNNDFIQRCLKTRQKLKALFEEYYEYMDDDMKQCISGYEMLSNTIDLPEGACRESAIKVSFDDGNWIRVYKISNIVKWY